MHGDLAAEGHQLVGLALGFERHEHADAAEAVGDRRCACSSQSRPRRRRARRRGAASCSRRRSRWRWRWRRPPCRRPDGPRRGSPRHRRGLVGDAHDCAHEVLERVVLGDEVGLGIDLDHGPLVPSDAMPIRPSRPRCGRTSCGLEEALLAQPVDCGLDCPPPVSLSAPLQSIMPAPLFSRSSLTIAAVISAIAVVPLSDVGRKPNEAAMSRGLIPSLSKDDDVSTRAPLGAEALSLDKLGMRASMGGVQATSALAVSTQPSRPMRPLSLSAPSTLAMSASFMAATCQ